MENWWVTTPIFLSCNEHDSTGLIRSAWAVKESMGGFPEGLMTNLQPYAVGLYDQCLAVRSPSFRGRYCTVFFYPLPVATGETTADVGDADDADDAVGQRMRRVAAALDAPLRPLVRPWRSGAVAGVGASLDLCVPSSCSAADVRRALAQQVVDGIFIQLAGCNEILWSWK